MMENQDNGLQKHGYLSGMTAHPVAPSVVDPTPHLLANIEQICIMIPVPKRVFMGSERGELASSQDDSSWNDTLRGRQNGHCTVRIVVPLIDRLIAVGVLPTPQKKYTLVWPDLESLSEDAAATVANKWVDFFTKYISGGVENIIDPMDALTRMARMPEDEAHAILGRTLKWLEFQKWSKMTEESIELEPTDEWPGKVPPGASDESFVAVGSPPEQPAPSEAPPGMPGGPPQVDEDGNPVEPAVDEDGNPIEQPPAGKGVVPPQLQRNAENAFCPGEGARDNSCSSSGGTGEGDRDLLGHTTDDERAAKWDGFGSREQQQARAFQDKLDRRPATYIAPQEVGAMQEKGLLTKGKHPKMTDAGRAAAEASRRAEREDIAREVKEARL
jgi:hypothetical protein